MAGGIKLSSPGKKSMSEDMFLDVPTMLAPSGKDAEQVHRSSVLDYASAARDVHSRVYGACTAEAAASETSGLSVGERSWSILWAVPRLRRMYTGSRTTEVQ